MTEKTVNNFLNIQIFIGEQSTASYNKYLFSMKYVLEKMLENVLPQNTNMIEKLLKFSEIIVWQQFKAIKNIYCQ